MAGTDEAKRRAPGSGPNLIPLQDYLVAQKRYLAGDREGSLQALSRAVGSSETLDRLAEHLDKVFETGTPLSDLTLHLTLVESKK